MELVTAEEACAALFVSMRTFRRWRPMPFGWDRGRAYYDLSELRRLERDLFRAEKRRPRRVS